MRCFDSVRIVIYSISCSRCGSNSIILACNSEPFGSMDARFVTGNESRPIFSLGSSITRSEEIGFIIDVCTSHVTFASRKPHNLQDFLEKVYKAMWSDYLIVASIIIGTVLVIAIVCVCIKNCLYERQIKRRRNRQRDMPKSSTDLIIPPIFYTDNLRDPLYQEDLVEKVKA